MDGSEIFSFLVLVIPIDVMNVEAIEFDITTTLETRPRTQTVVSEERAAILTPLTHEKIKQKL